jgi:hypothetical protein
LVSTGEIAIADLNGDGSPDLVITESAGVGAVGVMLGNGDGTFEPVVSYSTGGDSPTGIVIADVNGDHKPDVLATTPTEVLIYLGNGDGTLQLFAEYSTRAQKATSIAAADLNQDGKIDLVTTSTCSLKSRYCTGAGVVSVFLGNGNGTFKAPKGSTSGGTAPTWVAIADVNGDKKPDVLIVNELNSYYRAHSGILAVLLNAIP